MEQSMNQNNKMQRERKEEKKEILNNSKET